MFNIGDKVVYPMHGAGIIESIEEKEILGEKRKYYILRLPLRNMKVMIPLDNVDTMGLREIISEKEVEQVIAVLNDDKSKMPQNWNRRYRANMDKIKSGDIYEVAGVVRNLMLRDKEKGLSTGERKMLNNAKQILVSELVLVNDSDEFSVEKLINQSIQ
ncbi:CarD family transcriptional regulator [Paramaledivibacter caminithermalis]|jgi:CarD family transcriptional regulator|uniref:Transcriptional regulator, CarD family n=1 Tax=Paramaledivibacter caminithermalis (strain DSM 15212 / CIP 107654 / DViRD3) TaxID=1121301 RepID=A0A1M6N2L0_PARC5|nr:CarD family transcriptional regulator [Paramaledivibacter caminithermalis]SHJ89915.1 transcriptional regulator, CarD family [Paramaledivibacter caminithermalis DSM 15212]